MKINKLALVAIASSSVAAAQSQPIATVAPVAAAPVVAVAAVPISPITSVLRVGTVVPLKTSEQLTTKDKVARVGQRFRLEVSENVMVDGQIVVPVGSPAMGELTEVRNKGMWGKSGHLTAQILYVQVNGRQIRLRGTFDDKGVTGTAGVVAAIAFIPIAGFVTTGTSANIPSGSGVKAFIDEDVPVQLAAAASVQAPLMAVPAAVPVAATALAPQTVATAPVAKPALPLVKAVTAPAPGQAPVTQPAVVTPVHGA